MRCPGRSVQAGSLGFMGTTSPIGQSAPDKQPAWKVGGATILSFVALLYLIEIADQLSGNALDRNGIRPLERDGLWGVIFAPLLHADWTHLLANTVPALVLGFLVTLAGLSRFVWATAIIWIVGGLGTWLIGGLGSCNLPTNHIGASGLIFGWLAFLLVFGWLCVLHFLLMKQPVWHLLARIDLVGGSTGWHRYHLVDKFFDYFHEWWLLGTPNTGHWGPGLHDVTNQFVAEGVSGGILQLAGFCASIWFAFTGVSRSLVTGLSARTAAA